MRDYLRPETLTETVTHLAQGGWRILAGGTDLYPSAGSKLLGPVMDLTSVTGLRGIGGDTDLRIGAAGTWTDIAEAVLPPALFALQQAARQVGGRQIQNTGTIGGNLCNASPAADGVPPLLALDAEVELFGPQGTRRMALSAFLVGPRRTVLQPVEVLTAVIIPQAALSGRSAFVKLGARTHLVISIAMVAVRVVHGAGHLRRISVAVGSCSGTAQRLPNVEKALSGAPVTEFAHLIRQEDVAAALAPIDDMRASAEYRIAAATELIARAVAEAVA